MRTLNSTYLPALDHLRLLAALLVFAFHTFHLFYWHWQAQPQSAWLGLVVEGHTGVALFFVLSGFLFMLIALQSGQITYAGFLRNRFLRIFPLFMFFFFVAISVGRDEFRPADILYVFFSNIGQAPTSNSFITGAAWTISVEFTFYFVFPFLARFAKEGGVGYLLRLLVLLLLVKLAAYAVSQHPTHMFYSTLVGRFDQFMWGMVASMIWHRNQSWFSCHGRWLLPVGVLIVGLATAWLARHASYFLPQPRQSAWVIWSSVEALAWCILLLGYLSASIRWPSVLARALAHGAAWSYSFYLWHGLVLFTVQHYTGIWQPFSSKPLNAAFAFGLLLPPTLVLAAMSYYTIELPFLKLRGVYIRPASSPPSAGLNPPQRKIV